jgi:hypothetical protein
VAALDPIDIYCERTDPSFWAEPVNALSNFGFLLAAWLAFRHWRKCEIVDYPALGLILLVALIGLGSFLFHTMATELVALADVIPITLFVLLYLFLALRRLLKLGPGIAILLLAAFVTGSEALSTPFAAEIGNGSEAYLPPLAALVTIGMLTPCPAQRRSLLLSGVIFAVSLGFRTLDLAVCATWPPGTHFIWHMLNAWLLYRLVETMLATG